MKRKTSNSFLVERLQALMDTGWKVSGNSQLGHRVSGLQVVPIMETVTFPGGRATTLTATSGPCKNRECLVAVQSRYPLSPQHSSPVECR